MRGPLRAAAQAVVGVSLGANFTREMAGGGVGGMAGSAAGLLLFTACATAASAAYLTRVAGHPPTTAFFAGAPGGLNDMLAIGTEAGGDARTIGLTHACRLLLVGGGGWRGEHVIGCHFTPDTRVNEAFQRRGG